MDLISFNNWKKFLDGDQEALGDIFCLFYSDLVSYGTKIIGFEDLVKDCIQDLFVRLWEKRFQLRVVKNVKVYLLVCLKNDLLQAIKISRPETFGLTVQKKFFIISSEDFIIEKEQSIELADKVAACLDKLTARQREVIYLRFYLNLDFTQLSEVLEMNIQSVRNLLFRTLEKIRVEVGDNDIQQSGNIEIILLNLFGV